MERKLQKKVHLGNAIVPWMIRHAAMLITRCRVRPNGRTALEMIKGRKTDAAPTEFGESVLFKVPKTKIIPGKFEDTGVVVSTLASTCER